MLIELVDSCDELIRNTQTIVDLANDLPDTRANIKFQLEAERMLQHSKEYKKIALATYESYVNVVVGAVK